MPRPPPRRALGAIVLAVALVAGACDGSDDDASSTTTAPASTETSASASSAPEGGGESEASPTTEATTLGGLDLSTFDAVGIESTQCRFTEPEGEQPECYWLTVPQDWGDPDETDGIRLHTAVFTGADPSATPVVYLEGGPGRTGLETLNQSFPQAIAPLLGGGDVVVFDQRGTGLSVPPLECPELVDVTRALAAPSTPVGFDPSLPIADATNACRERLVAGGIELDAYNSLASAADADALRNALGIDQWNVYGLRYGTRLAQTYVREYGSSIRSVVLDAAYGIDADPTDTSASGEAAIARLFDDCAADGGCAARFPELRQRFDALRGRLDSEPLRFTSVDLGSGGFDVRADGQYLYDTVFGSLDSPELLATVPRLIEQLENGDSTIIELLAALALDRENEISLGQHLSVVCNEEVPFASGTQDLLYTTACPVWDPGAAPAIEGEALTSDVPALILAGEFDAVTPPSGSAHVGEGFTTSHFVELGGIGRGGLGHDCPDSLITAFLGDPTSPPDTGCVAGMSRPVYVTGDIGDIELEDVDVDFFGALVSTLRPAGWDLVQRAGGFIRMRDILDPTGIFTLAIPETDVGGVADRLQSQGNFSLIAAPPLDIGGRTWERFDGFADDNNTLTLAGTIDEGTTIVVMLEALAEERDALYDAVLIPVLEAIDITV